MWFVNVFLRALDDLPKNKTKTRTVDTYQQEGTKNLLERLFRDHFHDNCRCSLKGRQAASFYSLTPIFVLFMLFKNVFTLCEIGVK